MPFRESTEPFRETLAFRRTPALRHAVDLTKPTFPVLAVSDLWLEFFGYERKTVIGRPLSEFLTPDSAHLAVTEGFPVFLEQGALRDAAYQMVKADGTPADVLLSAVLMRNAHGLPDHSDAIVTDVSALRRAEREAYAASIAKSEWVAHITHDLRTPLNSVLGFSEVLRDDILKLGMAGPYREYADAIHGSGQRLLGMVNELIDLSRIEAGRWQVHLRTVSIPGLVAIAAAENRHSVEAAGQKLIIDPGPDGALAQADADALHRIIDNLIVNATRFAPAGTPVTIGWTVEDGQTRLRVSDKGPGIPAAEREKVIDAFVQLPQNRGQEMGGLGLGLCIVSRLCDLMDASLAIKDAPGGGALMELTLQRPTKGAIVRSVPPPRRTAGIRRFKDMPTSTPQTGAPRTRNTDHASVKDFRDGIPARPR